MMVAYCGLTCSRCDAFIATQAGDMAALERSAKRVREEFGYEAATAQSTMCDGCLAESETLCDYCYQCGVRACATRRGVVNCAHCAYFGCDTLEGFLVMAPEARVNLEAIRAGLAGLGH